MKVTRGSPYYDFPPDSPKHAQHARRDPPVAPFPFLPLPFPFPFPLPNPHLTSSRISCFLGTECLKDLQRFLAHDDPDTRQAFFLLGQFRTCETDVVPLLVHYGDNPEVAFHALKVATLLTFPVEPGSADPARQLDIMVRIRKAFLDQRGALGALVTLAAAPLTRHPRMSEKDAQIVQLIITFIRNLLVIPESAGGSDSRDGAIDEHIGSPHRARDALIVRLAEEAVMDMTALMAQHAHELPFRQETTLILEVVHAILAGIPPAEVLKDRKSVV